MKYNKVVSVFRSSIIIPALIMSSVVPVVSVNSSVYAEDDCVEDKKFLNANYINDYTKCGPESTYAQACLEGGSLTGPAPTSLKGESNAEKVWNYFTERGLSPVAAAGAMGNIEQESGFNPWIGEAGNSSIDKTLIKVGFGLIQWTNTGGNTQGRRYQVMKYLEDNGVKLDATNPSQNDTSLLYQLNFLWDVEYGRMTWQEEVNAETTIDGDTSVASFNKAYSSQRLKPQTGNGSTMVFHSLVERSNDNPGQLQERIDAAEAYLEQFGGSNASCITNVSMGNAGLTLEQAKKFMMQYGKNTNGFSASMTGILWNMCNGGGSNCVTFSHFFNNTFTDLNSTPGMGNGKDIVPSLVARGAASGSDPRLFATFSSGSSASNSKYNTLGHTGIVLGIQNGMLITGHASCGSRGIGEGNGTYGTGAGFVLTGAPNDPKTFFYYNNINYAYPSNVNEEAIMEFIQKGYVTDSYVRA